MPNVNSRNIRIIVVDIYYVSIYNKCTVTNVVHPGDVAGSIITKLLLVGHLPAPSVVQLARVLRDANSASSRILFVFFSVFFQVLSSFSRLPAEFEGVDRACNVC